MKKNIIAALVVLILGGSAAGFYLVNHNKDNESQNQEPANSSQQTQQTENQTQAEIGFSEDGKIVSYKGQENVTALETLKSLTNVKTKNSSYGEFVAGINGVEADESQNYWSFYINGKYADEGAGTYKAKATDNIEWKLEKIQ